MTKALDNGFPTSKKIAYDPDRGFYRTDTGSALARGQSAVVLGRATQPPIEWLMEQEQRDKRVGELLREQHYFDTSNPHPLMARGNYPNEEAFWLGQARMYPGLVVAEVEARRLARMNASSTAALQAQAA